MWEWWLFCAACFNGHSTKRPLSGWWITPIPVRISINGVVVVLCVIAAHVSTLLFRKVFTGGMSRGIQECKMKFFSIRPANIFSQPVYIHMQIWVPTTTHHNTRSLLSSSSLPDSFSPGCCWCPLCWVSVTRSHLSLLLAAATWDASERNGRK